MSRPPTRIQSVGCGIATRPFRMTRSRCSINVVMDTSASLDEIVAGADGAARWLASPLGARLRDERGRWMPPKKLGQSGLHVSAMSLGCWAVRGWFAARLPRTPNRNPSYDTTRIGSAPDPAVECKEGQHINRCGVPEKLCLPGIVRAASKNENHHPHARGQADDDPRPPRAWYELRRTPSCPTPCRPD